MSSYWSKINSFASDYAHCGNSSSYHAKCSPQQLEICFLNHLGCFSKHFFLEMPQANTSAQHHHGSPRPCLSSMHREYRAPNNLAHYKSTGVHSTHISWSNFVNVS